MDSKRHGVQRGRFQFALLVRIRASCFLQGGNGWVRLRFTHERLRASSCTSVHSKREVGFRFGLQLNDSRSSTFCSCTSGAVSTFATPFSQGPQHIPFPHLPPPPDHHEGGGRLHTCTLNKTRRPDCSCMILVRFVLLAFSTISLFLGLYFGNSPLTK